MNERTNITKDKLYLAMIDKILEKIFNTVSSENIPLFETIPVLTLDAEPLVLVLDCAKAGREKYTKPNPNKTKNDKIAAFRPDEKFFHVTSFLTILGIAMEIMNLDLKLGVIIAQK